MALEDAWDFSEERRAVDGNSRRIDGVDKALWQGQLRDFDWERGLKELRKIGNRRGIPMVPQVRVYHRYIYDNHTNVEGNLNMALEIADFLVFETWFRERYATALGSR